jgi:hypothetical protein
MRIKNEEYAETNLHFYNALKGTLYRNNLMGHHRKKNLNIFVQKSFKNLLFAYGENTQRRK